MIASFFAALFFAADATLGNHNIRAHGALYANAGRLAIAAVALGLLAHTVGNGFASASVPWFLLSGLVGMGVGDLGTFEALPRLGSRLTVLMVQCLAAPIAAIGEWVWLGTTLSVAQIAFGAVILLGVAVAMMPSRARPPRVRVRPAGFAFGLLAAAGQGLGALVSRKGVTVAADAGESVSEPMFGITAAYHRTLAGLIFIAVWVILLRLLDRAPGNPAGAGSTPAERRRGFGWMAANGLVGPVIAMGCFQWALATTPSGLVMPILATAPLLSMPIAWWAEGDRPSARAMLGGAIAVAGCAALTTAR